MSNRIASFSEIDNVDDLVKYLNSSYRLRDSDYVYQYTSLSSLIAMLDSERIHLCNAKYMNDQLEYNNGDKEAWKHLFFTCFMLEDEESIGMWSMYAQPWREGVKISIPKNELKKWVNEIEIVEEVDINSKELTGRTIRNNDSFATLLSAVAYTNSERINPKKEDETLCWGSLKNTNFHSLNNYKTLTGYLKDVAWSYEKEVRLKIKMNINTSFERIAIKIPEYIINSMIITASPLFEGNLQEELEKRIQKHFETEKSTFTGKLSLKDMCSDCLIRNEVNK